MAEAERSELETSIAEALEPLQDVRLAYLFGSQAQGTARPDSDLDIAIQTRAGLGDADRGEVVLDVIDALTARLGVLGERADVLDLERASPTIAFRVIREGRLVVCRDPRERIHLMVKVARQYDDTRHYRELFQRAAQAAAARMGRGSLGRS